MKRIFSVAIIYFTVAFTSCQNEAKKEILKEKESEEADFSQKMAQENFVSTAYLKSCGATVTLVYDPAIDAVILGDGSVQYAITFSVTTGNREACIPKLLQFQPGSSYTEPVFSTTSFTIPYAIFGGIGQYVDGISGNGSLTPSAFSASIRRLSKSTDSTKSGYVIKARRTEKFTFTGIIRETDNPEDVWGFLRYHMLGLPVKFRPNALPGSWTIIRTSQDYPNSMSADNPPPGFQ